MHHNITAATNRILDYVYEDPKNEIDTLRFAVKELLNYINSLEIIERKPDEEDTKK